MSLLLLQSCLLWGGRAVHASNVQGSCSHGVRIRVYVLFCPWSAPTFFGYCGCPDCLTSRLRKLRGLCVVYCSFVFSSSIDIRAIISPYELSNDCIWARLFASMVLSAIISCLISRRLRGSETLLRMLRVVCHVWAMTMVLPYFAILEKDIVLSCVSHCFLSWSLALRMA